MSSRAFSRAIIALAVFPAVLAAQPVREDPAEKQVREDPAEKRAPDDAAVVVSASRTEQRLRDAIPHTTVITRQDIRDSQAVDLPSLLSREAGLEFTQSGGVGSNSSLFMRGGRSAQTLVLIDGVRVEDAAFGTTAIQHIMLDEVERVEIVRGNVSSLYGSGAIGGVVEVFTRRGSGTPGPSAEASAGSRGAWKLRGGYGGQTGDTRFNVSASRFDTRGFSAIDTHAAPNANPDPDGYRNDSVSANIAQRLSAAHEVGAAFFRSRGRLDYDNAFGAPTDINQSAQDLGMAQVFWEAKFVERWKSRVTLAEGTDYRTDLLNGALNNSSNTRNRQVIWDNQLRLAPAHEVSIGLEELDQELKNSGLLPQERARRADIARLGYLGRAGNHSLQLNGRTEHYTDFGTANSYFAGYGYDVTEQWRLLASTSTAFRAPTFIDLYGFGGNPALKPERARTNELGLQWAAGTDRVRIAYFESRSQDAITFDLQTFTVRNVRKASVKGIESSYSGTILGIDFRAAFTVQDTTEQEPDGEELPAIRRARRYGSLAAYRSFGALRVGAELNGSGRRPDNDIATFSRIQEAGYTVVNFTARYDYTKHVYVAAKLANAFDERYQLVNGFNTPRLGMFVTVGWQP